MIGIIAPVLAIEEFVETSSGRIRDVCFHPAGQGTNVARAVRELGEECTLAGFEGGESGTVYGALLDTYGIHRRLVRIHDATPAVIKITQGHAEVASYSLRNPTVSRHESDDLYSAASLLIMQCPVVVISSVLATGMPSDFYARLIRLAHRYDVQTVVDVPPELFPETLAAGPTVIKPNIDQLRARYGLGPTPTVEDICTVADELRRGGASAVILSLGEDGALVVEAGGAWRLIPPPVEAVVEAGAGDCMVGGIAVGLVRGLPLVEAARLGAAAGAAKVMRHGLGSCKRSIVDQLLPRVQVRKVEPSRVEPAA